MTRPSLKHDASPEAFAAAMARCQGYAPACSHAGECAQENICFSRSGTGFKQARKIIDDMISVESHVETRVWLRLALDALDHHQFIEQGAIGAKKLIHINEKARRECGF